MDRVTDATMHIEQGVNCLARGIWDIRDDTQSLEMFHAWGNTRDKPHIHVRYSLTQNRYEVIVKDPVDKTESFRTARPTAECFIELVDTYLAEEDNEAIHYAIQSDFVTL